MSKICVHYPGYLLNRSLCRGHHYHVAIAVRLQDKTLMIVDPLIDQNQALGLSEWLSRQGVASLFIYNFATRLKELNNPQYFSYAPAALPADTSLPVSALTGCDSAGIDDDHESPSHVFRCESCHINQEESVDPDEESVELGEEQLCNYQLAIEHRCIETFFDSVPEAAISDKKIIS